MPHPLRRLPLHAALLASPVPALAQQAPVPVTCPAAASADADGQRDFDWEIGSWTTKLKRLKSPLSGSTTWLEYEGTTDVRPVMDGRANLVELKVAGPAGRIEGASLRLYNPKARQWALHFTGAGTGVLTPPTIGAFRGGCGEFYAQDNWNDRAILVRFVISDITPNSARFEQAFSADGGRNWEVNWIVIDTRRA
ncbi:hypothetical protein J2W22_001981 [Sphingomonas kyeonggiensis]|uniref:hypothetical protein n=1 Tax=Sphingomonas kyeonggiensis TaxID=1268553 RepID=UPI00277EB276|nr:hypothetical protein [Sphingomonas kyeonggiensis]MDQ0249917.1 hypothetical protein [Sphingomonas kyeonggiensis]